MVLSKVQTHQFLSKAKKATPGHSGRCSSYLDHDLKTIGRGVGDAITIFLLSATTLPAHEASTYKSKAR